MMIQFDLSILGWFNQQLVLSKVMQQDLLETRLLFNFGRAIDRSFITSFCFKYCSSAQKPWLNFDTCSWRVLGLVKLDHLQLFQRVCFWCVFFELKFHTQTEDSGAYLSSTMLDPPTKVPWRVVFYGHLMMELVGHVLYCALDPKPKAMGRTAWDENGELGNLPAM